VSSPSGGFPKLPSTPKSTLTGAAKVAPTTPKPLEVDTIALAEVPTQRPPVRVMLPRLPLIALPKNPQTPPSQTPLSPPRPQNPAPQGPVPQNPVTLQPTATDVRGGQYSPLPLILPQVPWVEKKNPSAEIVQNRYVELRLEELKAQCKAGKKAALQLLETYLLKKLPGNAAQQSIPPKELLRVYDQMERNLQGAELTINFKCDKWFTTENPYDSYTQMYERAVVGNKMVLKSTEMDDADYRGRVDNQITFPKNWQTGQGQTPLQRGQQPSLQVGPQGGDRIRKQMDTGELLPTGNPKDKAFHAGNPHFNPHAKQIFLGLNYGHRQHGSAPNFGYSYFVLKSELKPKCLFYAQDTYLQLDKGADPDTLQVPFDSLGALFPGNGDAHLTEAIFESCVMGKQLDDEIKTLCKFFLIEAHHFGELKFSKHIDCMVISPEGLENPNLWPTIKANARKFAEKNKIKLYKTS
jgi:hypothetical protein